MGLLKTHAHVAFAPSAPRAMEELLVLLRTGATAAERRGAALELAGTHAAAAELAARLPDEPSPQVREAIFTALVGIGTAAAADALVVYLHGEDVGLRNDAVEALRQIGAASGSVVERLLVSPDPDVRIFALNVLEFLQHEGAPAVLRHLLAQEHELNVGLAAVEALGRIGGLEDIPALRAFADRFDHEPFAAFAVEAACGQASARARA